MDNEQALEGLVDSAARAEGMTVDPAALDWIVERLGGDRGQTRSEIDKLILYKKSDENRTITLDDAQAVLGDTSAIGVDDVITATFDGDRPGLDRALDRVFAEGGHPVQLVRALQRYADQLNIVAANAKGGNFESAIFKARGLPRFGPRRQSFERHLRSWPLARLNAVLQTVLEAVQQCKTTGLPDEAVVRRLCLSLASNARPPARASR
jgi:DNA polymerase-3 subunit delta